MFICFILGMLSITSGTSTLQHYLRLSFDGGSRGANELGSGGAVLHFCYERDCQPIGGLLSTRKDETESVKKFVDSPPTAMYDKRTPTQSDQRAFELIQGNTGRIWKKFSPNKPTELNLSGSKKTELDLEFVEVELWKGSFFYGDGVSSHLAEYLALIDGLYAFKNLMTSDI